MIDIHVGDVRDILPNIEKLHNAAFMDVPYEMEILGKAWDNTGVAFDVNMWKMIYDKLYPGAFMFVYIGGRTYHKIATAIESANFNVLDPIVRIWGQNIPKSQRVKVVGYENYRYGSPFKKTNEFIGVFQKPYENSPVESIKKYNSGILNVELGKIDNKSMRINRFTSGMKPFGDAIGENYETVETIGRWMSNTIFEHAPECQYLGKKKIKNNGKYTEDKGTGGIFSDVSNKPVGNQYGDENGEEEIDNWQCSDDCGIKLLIDMNKDINNPQRFFYNADYREFLDDFIYTKKVPRSEADAGLLDKNPHKTLKPIKLNKYIASILLPPNVSVRNLLIPFAGVFSEVIGAQLAGWDNITAIELDPEYVKIGKQRLEYRIK